MNIVVGSLIDWPRKVAQHLLWLAPLFAGITVPHLLTPFTSGVEFFGGLFLLAGLLTRISAGALGITMIVAIRAAKWGDIDSLETLLGFDEFEYLALFLWLAIAGAGPVSIDHWLERWYLRERGSAARA